MWGRCRSLFLAESLLLQRNGAPCSSALDGAEGQRERILGLVGEWRFLAEGLRMSLRAAEGDESQTGPLLASLVVVHRSWLAGFSGALAWKRERDPREHLEACLSVLSMIFLSHPPGELTRLLDGIAEAVKGRLPTVSAEGEAVPDAVIVQTLIDHLFRSPMTLANRTATFEYDSPKANLPVHTLWTQPSSAANPVCLSVIMHLLLWRLGVKSELASLPRHFMLYLPCDNGGVDIASNQRAETAVFRDAFNAGRPVEGPMIVLLTGHRLSGSLSFLSGLSSAAMVLNRMLNNISQRARQWEIILCAMLAAETIDKVGQPDLADLKEKFEKFICDWDEAVRK